MKPLLLPLQALLAAIFASLCVFGEIVGCMIVMALGLGSLMILTTRTSSRAAVSTTPQFSQFLQWGVCVLLTALFVVLLAPFASMPAVIIALVLLSPFFGTWVYVAASAIVGLTGRST